MDKRAQTTTSPFSRLPQDCWEIIVYQLSLEELLSTSTTCRSRRASTERLVYRLPEHQLELDRYTSPTMIAATAPGHSREAGFELDSEKCQSVLFSCSLDPSYGCDMDGDQELSLISFAPVVEKAVEIVRISPIEEWIEALRGGELLRICG